MPHARRLSPWSTASSGCRSSSRRTSRTAITIPGRVAAYAESLGADGVNVEDSTAEELVDPALHAAKVAAIKQRTPGLFVNARVDTYWLGRQATIDETLRRAHAYAAAGADGIFVPGVTDPDDLHTLTSALDMPVNVLAHPTLTLEELARLGVRRVSTGSLPYRAAIDAAVAAATGIRDGRPAPAATPYPLMQQRLVRYSTPDPAS